MDEGLQTNGSTRERWRVSLPRWTFFLSFYPVWISFYFALNTIFVAPPVYHLFVFVFSLVNVLSWAIKTEVVAESSMEMLFERFLWDFILGLDTAVPFESCWMFFGKASFHLIVPFSSVLSKVVECFWEGVSPPDVDDYSSKAKCG